MNSRHRAIRTLLSTMSPRRAIEHIRALDLPAEEELFLVECDVPCLSYMQAADKRATTPEVIKRRRQRAYSKIADEIHHIKRKAGAVKPRLFFCLALLSL